MNEREAPPMYTGAPPVRAPRAYWRQREQAFRFAERIEMGEQTTEQAAGHLQRAGNKRDRRRLRNFLQSWCGSMHDFSGVP